MDLPDVYLVNVFYKAHVFAETFDVNSGFNAEVFVAPPHAVAMEFDLFGEKRKWSLV